MRLRILFAGLVVLGFGLACGGGDVPEDSSIGSEGDADVDSDADSDSDSDPDQAPEILEFSVNPTSIEERDDADFYALVTDPQGIDDLIGGSLKADGTTLAAFSSAADEGSYSVTVDFDTLAEAYGQDAGGSTATMTLTASFSDQSGNTSTAEVDLELSCDNGEHLCIEGCTDVREDVDHCGGCGDDCASVIAASSLEALPGGEQICDEGVCVGAGSCVTPSTAKSETCEDVCGDYGATCFGALFYPNASCSGAPEFDRWGDYCAEDHKVITTEWSEHGDLSLRCACAI